LEVEEADEIPQFHFSQPALDFKADALATWATAMETDPGVVKLVTREKSVLAHEFILTTRSSVFRAMFSAPMREQKLREVEIKDLDGDVLEQFVKCMYTDKCDPQFLRDHVFELLGAGDKYNFSILCRLCEVHILSNVSPDRVIEALIAAVHYGRIELKEILFDYLGSHFSEVRETSYNALDSCPELALQMLKYHAKPPASDKKRNADSA